MTVPFTWAIRGSVPTWRTLACAKTPTIPPSTRRHGSTRTFTTQAGNQLLALQSQQLSDLVAVLSAKSRADALEQARTASAEAQGQQNYQTFHTRSGYVPGNVTMFSGN